MFSLSYYKFRKIPTGWIPIVSFSYASTLSLVPRSVHKLMTGVARGYETMIPIFDEISASSLQNPIREYRSLLEDDLFFGSNSDIVLT
jgi:hypothetical protein